MSAKEKVRLDGKVAVVTGGGRGIGRAAASILARAGAAVAVVARTEEEIEETAEHIHQAGGEAMAFPADVTDWAAMKQVADKVARTWRAADIVVANAGILKPVGDTWKVEPATWAQNLDVNLVGAFYTTRAFCPAMIERGSGVLIYVSSGAATHTVARWSAYCAAKAGLDHFGRTVAAEIDQQGLSIRVHMLYPGVVNTAMQAEIRKMPEQAFPRAEKYRRYHRQGQLRPPEEPGTLIWWLSTPLAADFHGRAVSIDDESIRSQVATDLDLPKFAGRNR